MAYVGYSSYRETRNATSFALFQVFAWKRKAERFFGWQALEVKMVNSESEKFCTDGSKGVGSPLPKDHLEPESNLSLPLVKLGVVSKEF